MVSFAQCAIENSIFSLEEVSEVRAKKNENKKDLHAVISLVSVQPPNAPCPKSLYENVSIFHPSPFNVR